MKNVPDHRYLSRWHDNLRDQREVLENAAHRAADARRECLDLLMDNSPDRGQEVEKLPAMLAQLVEGLDAYRVGASPIHCGAVHPALRDFCAPALALHNSDMPTLEEEWMKRGFRTGTRNLLSAFLLTELIYSGLVWCANRKMSEITGDEVAQWILRIYRLVK